jgi:hypothetical protein
MLETKFQIQGEKTRLNLWMERLLISSFGIGVVCLAVPQWRFLLGFSVALFLGVLLWHIAAAASGVAFYQTKGRLELSEQGIKVDGDEKYEFLNVDLQRVEVKLSSYRGQAVGRNLRDGSGNKISFYLASAQPAIVIIFLADSYAQSQLFVKILRSWRAAGVKIVADGIDLV